MTKTVEFPLVLAEWDGSGPLDQHPSPWKRCRVVAYEKDVIFHEFWEDGRSRALVERPADLALIHWLDEDDMIAVLAALRGDFPT